jgi:methylated-DNA-protein-cysteine methyltransferase related protein
MNTFDKVYSIVSKIPRGKVTTYGAISKIAGINPRVVGYALHVNNDPKNVPCHRVINSKGKISSGYAFGGPGIQKKLLENEGIKFGTNEAVDLKKFGYFND